MKLGSYYKKVPIKLSYLIAAVSLLVLILWAQNGFKWDSSHLLFLISNYGIWLVLLPIINKWVVDFNSDSNVSWVNYSLPPLVIIVVHWFISNFIYYLLRALFLKHALIPTLQELKEFLVPSLISRLIDFVLFAGVLNWIAQNRLITKQKFRVIETETDLQRHRLHALKNQLNPHFLFNTMHTISALIGSENEKAQNLTIQMSHLLRKMLLVNELEEHSLKNELDFVTNYLSIESERFHDRVVIKQVIDPSVYDIAVPTLILQPLVENAFKHGISTLTSVSDLTIKIVIDTDTLLIEVVNELPKLTTKVPSVGVGLKNLRERLETFYLGRANLSANRVNNTFVARITILLP